MKLQQADRLGEAVEAYNRVLAVEPTHGGALNNLGVALRRLERFAEAVACYRRALEIDPRNSQALSNLGNALKDLHRLDEAIATLRRADAVKPNDAGIVYNLGIALKDAGRLDEALAAYDRALALRPDDPDIPWDIALALLTKPNFAKGWPAYEARWGLKDNPPRPFPQPRWHGEELGGRRILLTSEQGFGDTLQFIRYVPLVKAKGGHVIVEARGPLMRLVRSVEGVDEVVDRDARTPPAFDVHCPLLSLPMVFRTDLSSIPSTIPYLAPPPGLGAAFDAFLAPAGDRLKVGLVWSGSTTFKNNRNRATSLESFLPLLEVPGVAFVSLQKGPPLQELSTCGCRSLILDADPLLQDFADTAALIQRLDLVIMTDSAVAHLSGALGRPVWVLLCFAADWRWLTRREDSPWYPSMRLFRQRTAGRWDDVFVRVKDELAKLAAKRRPAKPPARPQAAGRGRSGTQT
jgi:hypothetical protein